jgi:hypothetical protein
MILRVVLDSPDQEVNDQVCAAAYDYIRHNDLGIAEDLMLGEIVAFEQVEDLQKEPERYRIIS